MMREVFFCDLFSFSSLNLVDSSLWMWISFSEVVVKTCNIGSNMFENFSFIVRRMTGVHEAKSRLQQRRNLVLLFFVISSLHSCVGTETITHCLAEDSEITCFFPLNVNTSRTSFCVYQFEGSSTATVLTCNWAGDKPSCGKREGFEVPETIGSTFTMKMTKEIHGEFGCDILDREPKIKRCAPPPKKRESSTASTTTTIGRKPDSPNSTGHKDGTWFNIGIYVLTAVFGVTCILQTIWICREKGCLRKNRHKEPSNNGQAPDENRPLQV